MTAVPAAPQDRSGGLSLRRRLGTALLTVGVLLGIIMVVGLLALLTVRDRQHVTTVVYYDAVQEANEAYTALIDAETAVRGYALTGDREALGPMQALLDRETDPNVAERLSERLGSDDSVVAAREAAAQSARTWLQDFALPTIERIDADGPGSVSRAEIREGQALFDVLRADVDRYHDLLDEARRQALEEMRSSVDVLQLALAANAITVGVLGLLLWVFLRRWVTDPLAALAEDARVVAAGDVDHRVDDTGPGEVGQVGRDVEEMRRRLALLLQEEAETRARLEESETLLREQAEDLGRSNRDLEQFAYVASHDLQEPLRKVASFTQLLAKRYEGQLDERADQYIAFAVDGAKRMQRLINDLLDFSRVGRIGGELAEVDMQAVLDRVTSDLDRVIEATGATVTGHDLPVVKGEEPLLVQLMTNLVGNALKFRHPDRAPVVRVTAERDAACWTLSCSDNGIGIDPQYAERVFVIFQRLHAKDVYEGTGIGLALCKKIVEYHGGDIWIGRDSSASGHGTTVTWTLPAVDDEAEPTATEGGEPARSTGHRAGATALAVSGAASTATRAADDGTAGQDALAAMGGREDGSDG